jgi:hypothetical protein
VVLAGLQFSGASDDGFFHFCDSNDSVAVKQEARLVTGEARRTVTRAKKKR